MAAQQAVQPAVPPPMAALDPPQQNMLDDIRKARMRAENGTPDPEPNRDYAHDLGSFEGAKAARHMSVRERETWRPRYESISVADLFAPGGEMLERQVPAHAAVIDSIQAVEDDLLEIYNFYAHLGHTHIHRGKLAMTAVQFSKLAMELGFCPDDTAVDDAFLFVADRTMHIGENGDTFIFFNSFPEALLRLGAVCYDWKVPLTDEELDVPMSIPLILSQARSASLTSSPDPSASCSRPSSGRPWLRGSPSAARPRSSSKPAATFFSGAMATSPAVSEDGTDAPSYMDHTPRPKYLPEQVLLLLLQTFIEHDVLTKARRGNTAGSVHIKQRAMGEGRLTPPAVWAP